MDVHRNLRDEEHDQFRHLKWQSWTPKIVKTALKSLWNHRRLANFSLCSHVQPYLHLTHRFALYAQRARRDRNDGNNHNHRHAADRNRHAHPKDESGRDGTRTYPRARARAAYCEQEQAGPPPRAKGLYEANCRTVQFIEMAWHRSSQIANDDGNKISKRQFSMGRTFPDALDLLLICVESGMSIEHAFRKVSQEIGLQSVPLAEELTLTTAELSFLPDRRSAFEKSWDKNRS